MKNLDWKNIINKVLSWGFPAVFCLLGIILTAVHTKLDIETYWGFACICLGVLVYITSLLIETKAKTLSNDNKILSGKVDKLTEKVQELSNEVLSLTKDKEFLVSELERKQKKIDKMEGAPK